MLFKNSTWIILAAVSLLVFLGEFAIYHLTLLQCTWPQIPKENVDEFVLPGNQRPAKIMLFSDTHVGSRHAWIDKLHRRWRMQRAFRTSMFLHAPDIVINLGDVLDHGFFQPDDEFNSDVQATLSLFEVDSSTTSQKWIPGNHDIGFHHRLYSHTTQRFAKAFMSVPNGEPSPVTLWKQKGLLFVFVNSMALEGDGCRFCRRADDALQLVAKRLQCLRGEIALESCQGNFDEIVEPGSEVIQPDDYSRPILIQHFPMFRSDETVCDPNEPDAMPESTRKQSYKPGIDCLSDEATRQLFHSIRPRIIFGGHTHFYCHRKHSVRSPGQGSKWIAEEWTLPGFSPRETLRPGFILLHATPNGYAVRRCHIPSDLAIVLVYSIGLFLIGLMAYWMKWRRPGPTIAVRPIDKQL